MASSPKGYSKITSLNTAKGLGDGSLSGIPSGAVYCVLVATGQAIRIRDDGTDPTATEGLPIATNTPYIYHGPLTKLKIIEQSASATVYVLFYKN